MSSRPWDITTVMTAITALAGVFIAGAVAATGPRTELTTAQRYQQLPELPTVAASAGDLAATAVALTQALGGVPADARTRTPCPPERLTVSYEEPVGYRLGAFVEPLGPPSGPDASSANGVVICEGSQFAFVGFEASRRPDGSWLVSAVPVFVESAVAETSSDLHLRYLRPMLRYLDGIPLAAGDLGPVDPYAPYQPQRLCDPTPEPGTVALARLLLSHYPPTASFGISRSCTIGDRSEHKEGRAFDWAAHVNNRAQREAVEDFLARLLATDADGNRHALARRMGVMYVIWDNHIWASYRANDGWRPYGGPSAHTDHVHLSLSWDGAEGRTSLWRAGIGTLQLAEFVAPGAPLPGAVPEIPDDVLTRADEPYRFDDEQATDEGADQESPEGEDAPDESDDGLLDDLIGDGTDDLPDDELPDAELPDDVTDLPPEPLEDPVEDATEIIEDTTGQLNEDVGNTLP